MEIKKIRLPKSMKFLTLLLTSMLISVASAQVYSYMFIQGTITVGAAKLIWEEGEGLASFSTVGSTATIGINVNGTQVPTNFTKALYLTNDYGAVNNIFINVTNPVGASDYFEAKMHIMENQTNPGVWTYLDYVDLKTLNDYYGPGSMDANDVGWRMWFEINATNSGGDNAFTITVQY